MSDERVSVSRAQFPQTIYAVGMVVTTDAGETAAFCRQFDVSGECPLTKEEAVQRVAAMLPPGWTWTQANVNHVVQKLGPVG